MDILEKRREVAKLISTRLEVHPDVIAVYVFGSVATGHIDDRSDVDMGEVA